MIHLRVIAPPALTPPVVELLERADGVTHLVVCPGAAVQPAGDLIECDASREVVSDMSRRLVAMGVRAQGGITVTEVEGVVGDAASRAVASVRGTEADALVWEELVARVRADAELSIGFLVLMACASLIAVVAIVTDNPVLVVGAMIVSPDFGPLAGTAVALVSRSRSDLATSLKTLLLGFATAILVAFAVGWIASSLNRIPPRYADGVRPLTDFISDPTLSSVMVAGVAGVAGAVVLARARSGAVIGVFVSITTIPAAANVGVALAVQRYPEARGALIQLLVNITGLVLAFACTLVVARLVSRRPTVRRRALRMDQPPSVSGR